MCLHLPLQGSKDSEGYPIVLFTVSRHETFKSDHKTDMQLLFYTLDQVAARYGYTAMLWVWLCCVATGHSYATRHSYVCCKVITNQTISVFR